ncbi:MAG: M3 family metallopeptidase [Rickettsiales bacterium]|jgi:oligoendopeptidase F|nr:M3 family metallopeptidase [Rickettsiales bacterium]
MDKSLAVARWDLSALYASQDDPRIDSDVAEIGRLAADFMLFRGRLGEKLDDALRLYARISELSDCVRYLYLLSALDAGDQGVKKRLSFVSEQIAAATSGMSFFSTELGRLDADAYERQVAASEFLKKNRAFADEIRKNAKYLLSDKEEALLVRLSPFGPGEWDDMLDEFESSVSFGGRTLAETLHIQGASRDSDERWREMKTMNDALASSNYMMVRARALNFVAGEKNMLDASRGYGDVMESRNVSNNLDNETVDALHGAVLEYGSRQGERYYRIMARLLGKERLLWSDRNAPSPFEAKEYIPYADCIRIVTDAYGEFSSFLAGLVRKSVDSGSIDAPSYRGKASGAFNSSAVGPGGRVTSYTLLNYMGSSRDVMTFAHELGHGVHGRLAGEAMGVLLADAPIAYAETASIFGEMLAFEFLLKRAASREARLALLLSKSNDWINSVNRQISFSLFERRFHERRKEGKVSPAEFDAIWLSVSREMYGGIFEYGGMEHLWCYVSHFMRPFYVYAYSFGELFTQGLFASRGALGAKFEPLYIDMLKSGGSRDAVALMAPFGLDPRSPDFWRRGIEASIGKWLDEAESLLS